MKTLNIDYLILNGEFQNVNQNIVSFKDGNFEMVLLEYGTKIFSKCGHIFKDGKRLGFVAFAPYGGSFLDDNFFQFQFENNILYRELERLKILVQQIENFLRAKFLGINRLDIAVDSERDDNLYKTVLFNLISEIQNKELVLTGKTKDISQYTDSMGKRKGYTIGKRSSDKFLRLYNKTDHLDNVQEKKYIRKYWERNGFDDTKGDVWRLEMQLNRRFLKDIEDVNRIFDVKFLLSMFKIAFNSLCDARETHARVRSYMNTKIELVDFEALRLEINDRLNFRQKTRPKRGEFFRSVRVNHAETNTILRNKIMLKKMFSRYVLDGQDSLIPLYFMKEIFEVNQSFYELNFFMKMRNHWLGGIEKEMGSFFEFDAQKFQNDLKFIENCQ